MAQNTWFYPTSSAFGAGLYQLSDSIRNNQSNCYGTSDPETLGETHTGQLYAKNESVGSDKFYVRNTANDGWNEGPDIDKDGWGLIHYRDAIANTATPSGATAVALPITDGSTTYYVPAYAAQWS